MRTTVILFILTLVIQCNCFLPIIGNALSTAQQAIHSKVQEGVSIVGGVSSGIINGLVNPSPPPSKPSQTVIIVVESDHHKPHGQGPPHHDHYPPHEPGYNHHGHHHNYPQHPEQPHGHYNPNNHGGYNHEYPQGPPNRPEFPNVPSHPNQGVDTNHRPNPNPGFDYGRPQHNGNSNKLSTPSYNQNGIPQSPNGSQNNLNKPNNGNDVTNQPPNKATTEMSKDDYPFFVPLNPADNGDQTKPTAPKRETDTTTKAADGDDELFPIDIRFKE